jgi:hypothetical protein
MTDQAFPLNARVDLGDIKSVCGVASRGCIVLR